jgi:hypothetical protein
MPILTEPQRHVPSLVAETLTEACRPRALKFTFLVLSKIVNGPFITGDEEGYSFVLTKISTEFPVPRV